MRTARTTADVKPSGGGVQQSGEQRAGALTPVGAVVVIAGGRGAHQRVGDDLRRGPVARAVQRRPPDDLRRRVVDVAFGRRRDNRAGRRQDRRHDHRLRLAQGCPVVPVQGVRVRRLLTRIGNPRTTWRDYRPDA